MIFSRNIPRTKKKIKELRKNNVINNLSLRIIKTNLGSRLFAIVE